MSSAANRQEFEREFDLRHGGDPLLTALTVLEHVKITDPSSRPDTEDAHNRVMHALNYLSQAVERREQEAAVWEAMQEFKDLEDSPVRRGFELDDAKASFDEAWAKYREQRSRYDRQRRTR